VGRDVVVESGAIQLRRLFTPFEAEQASGTFSSRRIASPKGVDDNSDLPDRWLVATDGATCPIGTIARSGRFFG
jgi:hypothetical protein